MTVIQTLSSRKAVKRLISWKGQRPIDKDRVNDIMNYHKKYKRDNGKWDTFTVITVCNGKYIIDGQHRFEAYKQFHNKGSKLPRITFENIQCNSDDEIQERFKLINRCVIVHSKYTDEVVDKTLAEKKAEDIMENLKYFFRDNAASRPFCKPNVFKEMIHDINLENIDEFIAYVSKRASDESFRFTYAITKPMITKCVKNGNFYLTCIKPDAIKYLLNEFLAYKKT